MGAENQNGDENAKEASSQFALLSFSLENAMCLRYSEETLNLNMAIKWGVDVILLL